MPDDVQTDIPDPVLVDLLIDWDERTAAGTPVTPEEVCRDHPDRLPDFRRHLAWVLRTRTLLRPPDPVPPELPGYEVLREVGRGGMGAVYAARDVDLDCPVAVKVPHAEAAHGVSRERFEREARTLAKLRHDGIVPVRAARFSGGRPFFVMDLLPGGSLADRKAAGPVPPAEVVALLGPVARAVHHAHAAGIVHRDLKPSNVLIDAAGRPRVGDFGVAGLLADADPAPDAGPTPAGPAGPDTPRPGRLTQTGRMAGTPAYAAPEVHPRAGGPPTPRSDIWSLGVILYELLTGQLPFGGDPVDDPPPDWAVGWPDGPRVDRRLRAVVDRCLAADPADRFASAEALADALEGWARRPRRRRLVRRVGLAAGSVLAVAAAAGFAFWPEPPEARRAAGLRQVQAKLAAGEGVDLLPDGRPHDGRVVFGDEAVVKAGPGKDGTFEVDAGPDRIALIGLVEDPGVRRYRFTVEVRVADGEAEAVGLFHSHQYAFRPGRPWVHVYGRVGLDVPPAGGWGGQPRGEDDFGFVCVAPPGEANIDWTTFFCQARPVEPAGDPPPRPWRRLTVEVDPDGVRGRIDELAGGPVGADYPFDHVRPWVKRLPNLYPPLAGARVLPVDQFRRLGVYVQRGKASFRKARIEPLPEA